MPPRRVTSSRFVRSAILLVFLFSIIQPLAARAADPYAGLQPAYQDGIEERFGDQLASYNITARFRPDDHRITATMSVVFTNFTGETLDEIAFRLFPNADYYDEGYLAITTAKVDGKPVTPDYHAEKTVMFLPIESALAPGGQVTIDLNFRTMIPTDSSGTFGVFSYRTESNIWTLADWYPIIAGWDPDLGWRDDPPTPAGDPTFADAALYDLALTLPDGYQVIGSGESTATTSGNGLQTVEISTGPARDLALVIAPDYVPLSTTVNGAVVSVWAHPDPESQDAAQWILDFSSSALAAYDQLFGPYLYTELDLAPAPIQQSVLGVSWTGLIMLSEALFGDRASYIDQNPDSAAFTIAHEMGHEWWGAMVGANSNDHPFMVEGLTNALTLSAINATLGPDAAVRLLDSQIVNVYKRALDAHGDGIVDTPIGLLDPKGPGQIALVYGKGALGFLAIRIAMGDEAFYAAIADYANTYLFANAEPQDLLAIFEKHAPDGVDVGAIWRTWFHRAVTTADDVDALAAELNQRFYEEAASTS